MGMKRERIVNSFFMNPKASVRYTRSEEGRKVNWLKPEGEVPLRHEEQELLRPVLTLIIMCIEALGR